MMNKQILGRGLGALLRTVSAPPEVQVPSASADATWQTVTPDDRLLEIPLEKIQTNPHQPRSVFSHESLGELTASIRAHGVIQPIVVTTLADGRYQLVAGERRVRASRAAGLSVIPAVVRSLSALESLELALIENLQREDLNPIEEAVAYAKLVDEFGLTQQELARRVGKGPTAVAHAIRILKLPAHMQKALAGGTINRDTARALLGIADPHVQEQTFQEALAGHISGSEIRERARKSGVLPGHRGRRFAPSVYDEVMKELRDLLGARVRVTAHSVSIVFADDAGVGRFLKTVRAGTRGELDAP